MSNNDVYFYAAPDFSLKGYASWARVVSVYDGDTIKVVMPFYDKSYRFSLRLMGIDTAEIKGGSNMALKARNRLVQLITESDCERWTKKQIEGMLMNTVFLVWVECLDFDKYGRVLARVSLVEGGTSFSDILVSEGLAHVYNGGTKEAWSA